jgi:hypothetical protein
MHSPHSTFLVAQQRIADLHRAADHDRLVHTATTATGSYTVPAPRRAAAAPVSFLRWLRRRLPNGLALARPREDQAGDCK